MSSLLTNTGAMTALTTLRRINRDLSTAQDQISTGKRVDTARDNSSLWQIAATMDSDARGFEALSTSMSLSKATVGTARAAAERVVDQMTQLRERIITANQPDADFTAVDTEVQAMKAAIRETIESAQVNGINLLTGGDTGQFLMSLNRSDATTVGASRATLGNQGLLGQAGALLARFSVDAASAGTQTGVSNTLVAENSAGAAQTFDVFIGDTAFADGDVYSLVLNGQVFEVEVTDEDVANQNANTIAASFKNQIEAAFDSSKLTVAVTDTTTAADEGNDQSATLSITAVTGDANEGDVYSISAQAQATGTGNLTNFDTLTTATQNEAALALTAIEGFLATVKSGAAEIAAIEMRLDMQDETIKALTDSLKTGAGGITDADMEAAAARLQALQVQQQLGVQALSIANQQPQTILQLFQ